VRRDGYSLLELMATLGIVAIVLALAVPATTRLVLDARRTTDVNALVAAIQLARSESAKRAAPVVLCKTHDLVACGGTEISFRDGWMVFVNLDGDSPPRVDADEPMLLAYSPAIHGTIRSNRPLYIFRPRFGRSTNGTITFCDQRAERGARAVVVSYTGRPRVTAQGPGGRALSCAA
jgi:type IV fimbrial biogenesis protein FimT